MARQILRREGLASCARRTWHYIYKWPSYLLFAMKMMRLNSGCGLDLHKWVNFAFTGYSNLIMPLQIRSEILQLLDSIQSRPPKYILEIGTSNGGTLFLLSRVATEDACVISIDLPLGPYGGGYPAWKRLFYKSFARKDQVIRLIRADSHEPVAQKKVEAILQANRIDLLFIDGDHTYEGVRADFEMYEPFVKEGGMIVFHDIVSHRWEHDCGVDRFWDEIRNSHEHLEFIENPNQGWAGLGLILKGGSVKSTPSMGAISS
jgi:predicted O-methyltransferase YrrM